MQIAYAIGVVEPVSVMVDTNGTAVGVTDEKLTAIVRKVFDLTPAGIISTLDLKKPIFQKTTNYGHFGRDDVAFTWEALDLVDALKNAAG